MSVTPLREPRLPGEGHVGAGQDASLLVLDGPGRRRRERLGDEGECRARTKSQPGRLRIPSQSACSSYSVGDFTGLRSWDKRGSRRSRRTPPGGRTRRRPCRSSGRRAARGRGRFGGRARTRTEVDGGVKASTRAAAAVARSARPGNSGRGPWPPCGGATMSGRPRIARTHQGALARLGCWTSRSPAASPERSGTDQRRIGHHDVHRGLLRDSRMRRISQPTRPPSVPWRRERLGAFGVHGVIRAKSAPLSNTSIWVSINQDFEYCEGKLRPGEREPEVLSDRCSSQSGSAALSMARKKRPLPGSKAGASWLRRLPGTIACRIVVLLAPGAAWRCDVGCEPPRTPRADADVELGAAGPDSRLPRTPRGGGRRLDTLRADRLGCSGFRGSRSPNIDAVSAEGSS